MKKLLIVLTFLSSLLLSDNVFAAVKAPAPAVVPVVVASPAAQPKQTLFQINQALIGKMSLNDLTTLQSDLLTSLIIAKENKTVLKASSQSNADFINGLTTQDADILVLNIRTAITTLKVTEKIAQSGLATKAWKWIKNPVYYAAMMSGYALLYYYAKDAVIADAKNGYNYANDMYTNWNMCKPA